MKNYSFIWVQLVSHATAAQVQKRSKFEAGMETLQLGLKQTKTPCLKDQYGDITKGLRCHLQAVVYEQRRR